MPDLRWWRKRKRPVHPGPQDPVLTRRYFAAGQLTDSTQILQPKEEARLQHKKETGIDIYCLILELQDGRKRTIKQADFAWRVEGETTLESYVHSEVLGKKMDAKWQKLIIEIPLDEII